MKEYLTKNISMEQQKRILISRNQRTLPRMANTTKRIQNKIIRIRNELKKHTRRKWCLKLVKISRTSILVFFYETYSFQETW